MSEPLKQRMLRLVGRKAPETELFADILYEVSRIRTLGESLGVLPGMICRALRLLSFRVYLRDGSEFRLMGSDAQPVAGAYRFAASSSTVLRMKRAREVARFGMEAPDGWQMLATAEEVRALEEMGAERLLPLEGRTALTGFAVLGGRAEERAVAQRPGEAEFLQRLGTDLGHSLETALLLERLSQEAVRRAHMVRELELAREVQERLLPGRLPEVPGMETAAHYKAAEQIGGDYFDLFAVGDGRVCVVIADVSGHGVSSALLMATLRASVHGLAEQVGGDLAGMVERLNRLLYSASSASRYSTMFLALYDAATGQLRYVNAGHNAPMLLRAGGTVDRLRVGGTVVGLLPMAEWAEGAAELGVGDRLVLYTDGVTEAVNGAGEEWGEGGLLGAVGAADGGAAEVVLERVLSALEGFAAGAAQDDDRTLLLLRRV